MTVHAVCGCSVVVVVLQPELLGDAVLAPVRANSGRHLYDNVTVVLRRTSDDAVVVHAVLHRAVSGRAHRLRPASVATSLAAVLGRLSQARHASSTSTHQLPAVLQLVRPTVRHRVSGAGCGRLPTADAA